MLLRYFPDKFLVTSSNNQSDVPRQHSIPLQPFKTSIYQWPISSPSPWKRTSKVLLSGGGQCSSLWKGQGEELAKALDEQGEPQFGTRQAYIRLTPAANDRARISGFGSTSDWMYRVKMQNESVSFFRHSSATHSSPYLVSTPVFLARIKLSSSSGFQQMMRHSFSPFFPNRIFFNYVKRATFVLDAQIIYLGHNYKYGHSADMFLFSLTSFM